MDGSGCWRIVAVAEAVVEVAVAEAVAEAAVAETQRLEPAGKIKQSQSLKRKVD